MVKKDLIDLIQWVWAESRITPLPALKDEDAECMLDEYLAEHKTEPFTDGELVALKNKTEFISKDELREYLKQELLKEDTKSLKVAVAQGNLIGGIMKHFDL